MQKDSHRSKDQWFELGERNIFGSSMEETSWEAAEESNDTNVP